MNASRIIFTISFFGFSSSFSVKSGILKSLKAVKLCWMFVFVFGLMFCITMTGHAWVTLAHCAGIYYWRHRLGYTHCVGTLLYILLAHSLYAGNTHNNVPTEYLLLYHILLYIHYILLYYTRNVPTGYLLQGIAASVLTSPWCQQSLPRPSFYSTWVRRGRCHGV